MRKKLSKWYNDTKNLILCISEVIRCWSMLFSKGQKSEYEILQTAHRLEKGLTNEHQKSRWGWEKAYRLAELIKKEPEGSFAKITGSSVLMAYLQNKNNSLDEKDRLNATKLYESFHEELFNRKYGGVYKTYIKDVCFNDAERIICERLFQTRHSARDFSRKMVKKEDLEKAIQLALRAPSACNRQPTKVYVFQEGSEQSLFLTCDIRAFCIDEFYDWIVSTSIFAGFLSLTLHLYGIGVCITRKSLYTNLKQLKLKLGVPKDEKIIIELKFGYYKDGFLTAVSNRLDASKIIINSSFAC